MGLPLTLFAAGLCAAPAAPVFPHPIDRRSVPQSPRDNRHLWLVWESNKELPIHLSTAASYGCGKM